MAALDDLNAFDGFCPSTPTRRSVQLFPVIQSLKAKHLRARADIAALKVRLSYFAFEEQKANYDENQPRWPRGSGEASGRWSGGLGSSAATERIRVAGGRGEGHHYVPRAVIKSPEFDLPADTRRVLDRFVTGPFGPGHGYTVEHRLYNSAVEERFRSFLHDRKIESNRMTPAQAMSFGLELLRSDDPRISQLNRNALRRRLLYLPMRAPSRGHE